MVSLYVLIPVAILFAGVAIALYIWSVNNRQFDDLDNEGSRILFDDDSDSQTIDELKK